MALTKHRGRHAAKRAVEQLWNTQRTKQRASVGQEAIAKEFHSGAVDQEVYEPGWGWRRREIAPRR